MFLNDQALTELAMQADPMPMLTAFSNIPQGNFLTMPQPEGVQAAAGPSYESIIAGAPMQAAQAATQQQRYQVPLDPTALRTLAAMNPPQRGAPGGASPIRFPQLQLGPVRRAAVPPTLAQILGR